MSTLKREWPGKLHTVPLGSRQELFHSIANIEKRLYKGLYPLWGRQIPYTMMKFASFERLVEMIYNYLPGQKSDYNKGAQTAVAFTGGYGAGILCAIVSHPADVMVSKLNANRLPGEAFGTAMGRIYKDIGFMGLWNGLMVRIVMIGTLVRSTLPIQLVTRGG